MEVRSLYDRYPDLGIDVAAEQAALARARVVVWQHPLFWYSVPALLKLWFDEVLERGWAFDGGTALQGKRCLWATTTGGDEDAYGPEGMHGHRFEAFVPAVRQTARFCGMTWEEPFVLHAAHRCDEAALARAAAEYRARLEALRAEEVTP